MKFPYGISDFRQVVGEGYYLKEDHHPGGNDEFDRVGSGQRSIGDGGHKRPAERVQGAVANEDEAITGGESAGLTNAR